MAFDLDDEELEATRKLNGVYKEKQELTSTLGDSISKSLIKETIEKLRKEYKEKQAENSIKAFVLKCQIEILEKLLKGEDYVCNI